MATKRKDPSSLLPPFLGSLILFSYLVLALHSHSFNQWPTANPEAEKPIARHGLRQAPAPAPKAHCRQGKYVYVYDLPREFNAEMVENCKNLSVYTDMCPHVRNGGVGLPIAAPPGTHSDAALAFMARPTWYATHQFIAEVIFHERMKNHPCRTADQSEATLFYVPFYAGLDMSRRVGTTRRDDSGAALVAFLAAQAAWRRSRGRDHFMVIGRTAWDFLTVDGDANSRRRWGNRLLKLPEVANMSVLVVERHPSHSNEVAIPYPSYFHPRSASEMRTWQELMRSRRRRNLFAFAGAPRPKKEGSGYSLRDAVMNQCALSRKCAFLHCGSGPSACHEPAQVMKLFMESEFCLQPPGDSFTRRSTFDAIFAGCIPVFFSEYSAYSQYAGHLPTEHGSYSVFVSEKELAASNRSVERRLASFSARTVRAMRKRAIEVMPRVVYGHPRWRDADDDFDDAVDVSLSLLFRRLRGSPSPPATE